MNSVFRRFLLPCLVFLAGLTPLMAYAMEGDENTITIKQTLPADLVTHWTGFAALIFFVLAYIFVVLEENIHMKKSKPVMVAAGIIWVLVAFAYHKYGLSDQIPGLVRHNMLEYAELALFLLSAMVYINTMDERNVFQTLRSRLVSAGFSLRKIYWITGAIAFFMSPVADNMTTTLVMGAVVLAVGSGYPKFILLGCINIVVSANAGGAFSPFGDITTLMVWQKGHVAFGEFLVLFFPALVSWLIPAVCMYFALPKSMPEKNSEKMNIKYGGYTVIMLFFMTIALTVSTHHVLHIPPFVGMMAGLGILKIYGYFIRMHELSDWEPIPPIDSPDYKIASKPFDIFVSMKRAEWDTLMFFYGVIMCVGGLSAMGYLNKLSVFAYGDLGATAANIMVGVISALIDNIPVMFAVLTMSPDMSHTQWLLVTLTAGIGGSLLSIGSAAGVALMGQARGYYTFFGHLKWAWAIALGYAAGIYVHIILNGV